MGVLVLIESHDMGGFKKAKAESIVCRDWTDIKYINSVQEIRKMYCRDDRLVLASALVPQMAEDMGMLDLIDDSRIYLYVQNRIIGIGDEAELLTLKESFYKEKKWLAVKKVNQVLLNIDFLKRKTIQQGHPAYLQLETSSYCNAQCVMCSHYYTNNREARHLKKGLIHRLANEMVNCYIVSLNGMGEPFLHPDICELIDQYSGYGAKIATNTNLSVLSDEMLKRIREHFAWIEISCDGATDYVYEKIRQNLSFQKFLANLKKLKDQCPNVRKHLTMVVMRQNVSQMKDIVHMASEYGIDQVSFSNLSPNMIIGNEKDVMTNYPRVLRYFTQQAFYEGHSKGIEVSCPVSLGERLSWEDVKAEYDRMISEPDFKDEAGIAEMMRVARIVETYKTEHSILEAEVKPSSVKCSGICDWILERVYIDLEGNSCMCCSKQLFRTGTVDESVSLEDVWNGTYYQKLREMFYSGVLPESCLGCGLIENQKLKYLRVPDMEHFHEEAQFHRRKRTILNHLTEENR